MPNSQISRRSFYIPHVSSSVFPQENKDGSPVSLRKSADKTPEGRGRVGIWELSRTLPKTTVNALRIGGPQKESSLPTIHFQVQTVTFREGRWGKCFPLFGL